jgi:cobalt transporter subunit CbtB
MPLRAPEAYQYARTEMTVQATLRACTMPRRAQQRAPVRSLNLPSVRARLHDEREFTLRSTTTASIPGAQTLGVTARWPAFATLSLGLVVLYFIGFSPIMRAHNAAHDTRHANGFPCH